MTPTASDTLTFTDAVDTLVGCLPESSDRGSVAVPTAALRALAPLTSGGVNAALGHALRHFLSHDEANAALHCAPVRYSPITFRLAEQLHAVGPIPDDEWAVASVLGHAGQYEEDRGR